MSSLRYLPLVGTLALLVGACASIGRPEGGPRDEHPPVFVSSNPMPRECNVKRTSFSIFFDENVQLEDAFNKVVFSPVQIEAPQVTANGKKVTVEMRDTLIPNVTYTIDFGDAIKDLNEGNVLDGFALDFSTGDQIDTLCISGVVLYAADLEPAQSVLVGAWANTADSAIRTLPPDRIARTNSRGQFAIRNLAQGSYRLYALNDLNRDYMWDRSEDVAFLDSLVTPYVVPIVVTDTLYDSHGEDSLVTRAGHRFLPNDILLTMFNENYKAQYLKDKSRPERRRALITLGAHTDSLPQLSLLYPTDSLSLPDPWLIDFGCHNDSINVWFADPAVIASDTVKIAFSYMKPDSTEMMHWTTDTLSLTFREPKKKKKDEQSDTIAPKLDVMQMSLDVGSSIDVFAPLKIKLNTPAARFDTSAISISMAVDTMWENVPFSFEPDSLNPLLGRVVNIPWVPGAKYRFHADSASVANIYGEHIPKIDKEFTVKKLEDYATLTFVLTGADSTVVVELLTASDAPARSARVDGNRAVFQYVTPGTYYARLFFDTDNNGIRSSGILDSVQPEEVAYYPNKLTLKGNWEVEQPWDIYNTPIDAQKPYAILKNKPKLKRGEQAPQQDEEEEEDELLGPANDRNSRNNRNNRNNSSSTLNGGFQSIGNPNRL